MADQQFEMIEGVEGLVGTRVMEYGGQLFFEVEPQDDQYRTGAFNAPPILRIPIDADTPEQIAMAKGAVPEGLTQLGDGDA
jgi:hypothetical protein